MVACSGLNLVPKGEGAMEGDLDLGGVATDQKRS